jgi:hypothetical protein
MLKKSVIAALLLSFATLTAYPANAFNLDDLKAKLNQANPSSPAPAAASAPAQSAAPAATGGALSSFSNQDQVTSLKQALAQGAETSVRNLARENGYLGNDKVRIPLPESLQKVDGTLRRFGMGKYADELVTSMNRAAEAAVPEAKTLLTDAVKKMTVEDAKGILTGGDDAATQYFRKNTETALAGKFKPIINKAMLKVKVAEKYDQFAGTGAKFGLVDERDARLDDYITRKAMDGLFLMMAEQEKAIRANPLEATGSLAKKVFSAIRF